MSLLVPINGQNYVIPTPNEVGWGSNLDDFFTAISNGTLQKTGGSFTLSAETDFGASFGLKSLYLKSRSSNVASTGAIRLANAETGIVWRNALNNADLPLTVNSSNQLTFNGTPIESNALSSAHILVGNGSNVATDVAMSGDVGIDNTGLTTIQSGVVTGTKIAATTITNSNISASAAIAYSKLALTGSIVNADVNASAAIAYSKLALTGSIVNADVGSSAAIALSKLAALGTAKALQSNASTGLIEASSVTNTELGYVSGVTSAIQTQLDAKMPKSGGTFTNDVTYASGKGTFWTDSGTNTVKITAPTTITPSSYTLKWPVAQGGANQYLTNDGSGNLSWTNAAGTGTVNSGTAGRLSLYATSTNAISDTYVQNANNLNVVIAAHGTLAATRTYTIPDAGASASFVMTQGDQTLAGVKTFSSQIAITATSNQLALSTATNKAILTAAAQATADRTYTIPDSGANASFVMTQGAQTIAGALTLSSASGLSVSGGNLAVSTSDANVLIGSPTVSTNVSAKSAIGSSCALSLDVGDNTKPSQIVLYSAGTSKWFISNRNHVDTPNDRLAFFNAAAASEIFTLQQDGGVVIPNTKLQVGTTGSGNQVYPIVQVVSASTTTQFTTSSATFQTTNLTASITPKFNTSKIIIYASGTAFTIAVSGTGTNYSLFRDTTNLMDATNGGANVETNSATAIGVQVALTWYDSPATTSAITYSVKLKSNGSNSAKFGLGETQAMVLIEVAQ